MNFEENLRIGFEGQNFYFSTLLFKSVEDILNCCFFQNLNFSKNITFTTFLLYSQNNTIIRSQSSYLHPSNHNQQTNHQKKINNFPSKKKNELQKKILQVKKEKNLVWLIKALNILIKFPFRNSKRSNHEFHLSASLLQTSPLLLVRLSTSV